VETGHGTIIIITLWCYTLSLELAADFELDLFSLPVVFLFFTFKVAGVLSWSQKDTVAYVNFLEVL